MADFPNKFNQCVKRQDGFALSQLVSITNPGLMDLGVYTNEAMVDKDIRRKIHCGGDQWSEVAVCHWKVAQQVVHFQNLQKAYKAQNELLA